MKNICVYQFMVKSDILKSHHTIIHSTTHFSSFFSQRIDPITINDTPYSMAVLEALKEHGSELFRIHPKGKMKILFK